MNSLPNPTPTRFIRRSVALCAALFALTALPLQQPAFAQTSVTTASGLVYESLREGTGPSPQVLDRVKVHYRGMLADGKEFDSSYTGNQPAEFPLNKVIKCWTEGLQRMKVGGKARLTCPPAIGYGARGAGDVIPPNATLTFEVELLGIAGK